MAYTIDPWEDRQSMAEFCLYGWPAHSEPDVGSERAMRQREHTQTCCYSNDSYCVAISGPVASFDL